VRAVDRIRVLVATCLLATASACEFGERAIAPPEPRAVVHAVLAPEFNEQSVLVEELLTGRVTVNDSALGDGADPIVTGGGVPISGARVTVSDDAGNVALARETQVSRTGPPGNGGTGVYRFINSPSAAQGNTILIQAGRRYTLRVETPDGRVVTGTTTVPGTEGVPAPGTTVFSQFNRDRDTLALSWNAMPGARSYAVRIDSPLGPFFLFSDSTTFRVTGELRNLFAERLPRLFVPGFRQTISVAAVEGNYFDYYRSGSNPFTGTGIINRLSGGIGLFGAYVPIKSHSLQVVGEADEPIEGRYVAALPRGRDQLRVWIESRDGDVTVLTGSYRLPGEEQFGYTGSLQGDRLALRAFLNQDTRQVFRELVGTVRGDTLFMQVTRSLMPGDDGRRVFVKTTLNPGPGTP
jgi:hypothetical protein